MFSGIVEATAAVVEVSDRGASRRLRLDLSPLAALDAAAAAAPAGGRVAALGDSVAVNGVCLTVAALEGERAEFDVVAETLQLTNLGALAAGDRVNVERALRYGDRVDGHLVQGHVEGTGRVSTVEVQDGQTWFGVECGAAFAARCLHKGSVALDGVSLTLAELGPDALSVALVPHTLQRTTLGDRAPGDRINLEADLLGQWVLAAVARGRPD